MAISMEAADYTHHKPPASMRNVSPRPIAERPTLPDKRVISATIEQAYVDFILYCNPAVPSETDTTGLREAFRTPPKSDGKSFSSFTLFELIKQLEAKEIKTWAELALKLGVAPPDQDKGQSSQKIQQYAVRLKRWMHSMHADAFFDYLLGSQHSYWTEIPSDPSPVCEEGRDGVAAEDDMALRALLPHIRPRRGRKKPDDDGLNKSPSQRRRLLSPTFNSNESWTAHPDGARAFLFPPADHARSAVIAGSDSAFQWHSDLTRTPMTAYPQSAMTPVNGRVFWTDPAEPRSAITPPKAKMLGRRHGAKVVSSAWRSGGTATNGKTRGRPPINRANDTPPSAFSDSPESRGFQTVSLDTNDIPRSATAGPPAPMLSPELTANQQTPARPARPGRLSLQVPERPTGSVRLASPPPVVMVNGERPNNGGISQTNGPTSEPSVHLGGQTAAKSVMPTIGLAQPKQNQDSEDRDQTNVKEIENLFVSELMVANWYDTGGTMIPACSVDEAMALSKTIIETMKKQAVSKEAFLINLSALAGGSMLQSSKRASINREEGSDCCKYTWSWELQYGSVKGNFSVTERVPYAKWKKGGQSEWDPDQPDDTDAGQGDGHWRRKYEELLGVVVRANSQRDIDLRMKVLESIKDSPRLG